MHEKLEFDKRCRNVGGGGGGEAELALGRHKKGL